jgi:uncharacterized membrane protein YphA (DoxX/SURF4 family)
MLWDYRELLLDENGLVPWALGEGLIDPLMPRISAIAALLAPMGVSSRQTVTLVTGVHLLAATGLLVGFRTRACAFVAWITHLALIGTGAAYAYGLGKILVIALFYCLVMPVGREWSLDRSMRRRAAGEESGDDATLSVLVLRLHLCVIYGAAGISKAASEEWWSGEAVWRALSLPQFQQFDPSPLGAYPLVLQALALGSMAVQLAYPMLVWTRLRVAIVILSELLHLGIAVFLGLWLFSGVMIVLNAAAFGESIWRMFSAKIPRARPALAEKRS